MSETEQILAKLSKLEEDQKKSDLKIKSLENKISNLETENMKLNQKIKALERQNEKAEKQAKLINAPIIKIKHDHKDWINTICLTKYNYIVTGSRDKSIKCSHFDEGVKFTIENAHSKEINYIIQDKINDSNIFSCGADGLIKYWSLDPLSYQDNYNLILTISAHDDVKKCIILNNGNLCSCGRDGKINFWIRETEKFTKINTLTASKDYVQSIIEYKDKKLVSASWGVVDFWDIENFKLEKNIDNVSCHDANSMIIYHNDTLITTDGSIFIFNLEKQQLIQRILIENEIDDELGVYGVCSFCDHYIITGGNSRYLEVFDMNDYQKIASRPVDDMFIFGIINDGPGYIVCGSESVFAFIINQF